MSRLLVLGIFGGLHLGLKLGQLAFLTSAASLLFLATVLILFDLIAPVKMVALTVNVALG